MVERRTRERRRNPLSGRRTTDPQGEDRNGLTGMRQEITRLKAVIEVLIDAVQALTATIRRNP
jgi:hypothetical protein